MREKFPSYNFEDTEIKNEQELAQAKKEAGVRSEEAALHDAYQHAIETKDDVLKQNVLEKMAQSKQIDQDIHAKKESFSEKKDALFDDYDEIKDLNDFVKRRGFEEPRANRAKYLHDKKEFTFEQIDRQFELEDKRDAAARKSISYRAEQGGVVEKVYRDKEALTGDKKDLKKEAQERN